jgi:Putative adhesin
MRVVKRVLVVVVVLVVLVAGGLAVANFVLDSSAGTGDSFGQPIREIVVKSGAGDIDLVPASERVEVRSDGHYVLKRPSYEVSVKNAVLTVETDCAAQVLKCYTDLRIAVPRGVSVTIDAEDDVDAREVALRAVHIESDSGNVQLGLVGRQGLVWAHSDSGRVDVIAADARAVDAQSDSGDVAVDVFRRAPRRVVARSDSGLVQVLARKGAYAITANSDSGDVKITGLTRNARARRSIEASSDSGDVALRAR